MYNIDLFVAYYTNLIKLSVKLLMLIYWFYFINPYKIMQQKYLEQTKQELRFKTQLRDAFIRKWCWCQVCAGIFRASEYQNNPNLYSSNKSKT